MAISTYRHFHGVYLTFNLRLSHQARVHVEVRVYRRDSNFVVFWRWRLLVKDSTGYCYCRKVEVENMTCLTVEPAVEV